MLTPEQLAGVRDIAELGINPVVEFNVRVSHLLEHIDAQSARIAELEENAAAHVLAMKASKAMLQGETERADKAEARIADLELLAERNELLWQGWKEKAQEVEAYQRCIELEKQVEAANTARREAQLQTQQAMEARNAAGVDTRRPLMLRIRELEREASLFAAVQRACDELPMHWQITIELEKDAGSVLLANSDGDNVDFATHDETMGESINDALNHALAAAQKGGEA